MADGPCQCGSPLARIANIQGRREETLRIPTGTGTCVDVHAGRLATLLLHIGTEVQQAAQHAFLMFGVIEQIAHRGKNGAGAASNFLALLGQLDAGFAAPDET